MAHGYNTFADIHLVFTMFLVDKQDKPTGGFIYPILRRLNKAGLLNEVRRVLRIKLNGVTFEEYLRKYRNRLATHGDLSARSLPDDVHRIVLGGDPNERVLELLDELRDAVDDLTTAIQAVLDAVSS